MTTPAPLSRAARATRWRAALAAALALAAAAAAAKGGAYRESAHGNRATGVLRVTGAKRGDCAQCHGAPPDARGQPGNGRGHTALFAPNDNGLCLTCHRRAAGGWLGESRYGQTGHALSPAAVWPGPQPAARQPGDAGKCVNCHDPHGARDEAGLIPRLARVRGAALCLRCHTGVVGPDVASAIQLPYRHPLGRPGAAPQDATCAACHNPHASRPDASPPRAPAASGSLAGVARVRLAFPAPGSAAALSAVPPADQVAPREHEVCLRCHAGQGEERAQVDVAALLNPANASFHPVLAPSRAGLDRRTLAGGWAPGRQAGCVDCHSGAAGQGRGPHGSTVPHLLKRPYNATLASQPATDGDLCFDCHAPRPYTASAGAAAALTRYPGHAAHVGRGLSCFACHDAHGSPLLPALLRLRPQALTAFTPEPAGGGTCTAACHTTASPIVGYRPAAAR